MKTLKLIARLILLMVFMQSLKYRILESLASKGLFWNFRLFLNKQDVWFSQIMVT